MEPRYAAAVARSVRRRMAACQLDLRGLVVATECANGAYATTAAAAVAAGAREVWCLGRDSRWATLAECEADVRTLLRALDAPADALRVTADKAAIPWSTVDLVTNSGHLRPLDAATLGQLPRGAAIALMFEAWELRDGDIDLATVRERGLPIFGVDEHHPACGSFEFVGALAVSEFGRRGWGLGDARVAVLSDNAFREPVLRALVANGADAVALDLPTSAEPGPASASGVFDLLVVATTPPRVALANGARGLSPEAVGALVQASGAYGCVQLWGDIDRSAAPDVAFSPAQPPAPGHQGVPMNAAGFEATVRLQVGGLAAGAHGLRATRGTPLPLPGLVQPTGPGTTGSAGHGDDK